MTACLTFRDLAPGHDGRPAARGFRPVRLSCHAALPAGRAMILPVGVADVASPAAAPCGHGAPAAQRMTVTGRWNGHDDIVRMQRPPDRFGLRAGALAALRGGRLFVVAALSIMRGLAPVVVGDRRVGPKMTAGRNAAPDPVAT